jgi:AcrR family transcriptional regulator
MAVKRKVRKPPATSRRGRAHGDASRERILEAAREIAGERGYDGTSIALVSERSGLPASSIYWHFEDKDHLIAAVIERSFGRWLLGMGSWFPPRKGATLEERVTAGLRATARALTEAPDFLRLGLMLSLERRPEEASARTLFLQVREQTLKQMVGSWERSSRELGAAVRPRAGDGGADGCSSRARWRGRARPRSTARRGAAGAAERLKPPAARVHAAKSDSRAALISATVGPRLSAGMMLETHSRCLARRARRSRSRRAASTCRPRSCWWWSASRSRWCRGCRASSSCRSWCFCSCCRR